MNNSKQVAWEFAHFDSLTAKDVYDMLAARQDVFVVEQDCVFQDIDGRDLDCWHLLGRAVAIEAVEGESGSDDAAELAAYARILAPGVVFAESSIGRIVTTKRFRGMNIGRELMQQSIDCCLEKYPGPIRIGAQIRLEKFYNEFGFERASEPYDEDGIEHIEMVRSAPV